jgi:hypothetical protein
MGHASTSCSFRTAVFFAVIALCSFTGNAVAQPPLPEGVDQAYAKYKQHLLTKFTDKYGLVVDLDDGKASGIGDSAWRTGLAALCMALEKDNTTTRNYLSALSEKCWRDGRPIRHPDSQETGSKTYSRDQFIPQMVACFFAHEFGDDQTKQLAKNLFQKFIDRIRADDWKLNEGEAATINEGNRFAFFEVADRLGLVEGPKLKSAGGPFPRSVFIAAMAAKRAELKLTPTDPSEFFGVHLMFLEALITIKCRPQTQSLISTAHGVADEAASQNMALFMWLRGNENKPRDWLANWPLGWNRVDYVWQRNKKSQDDAAASPADKKEYARLDYMLLRRLLELDIRRE